MGAGLRPDRDELYNPIEYNLKLRRTWAWERLEKLADSAQSEMVRVIVLKEYIARLDPIPKSLEDGLERPIAVNLILAGPAVHANGLGVNLQLSDGHERQ